MQKLNKKRVNQTEALKLMDEKLNQEYVDFISSNSTKVKVVQFSVWFVIEMGSVKGSVYFEEIGKLLNVTK